MSGYTNCSCRDCFDISITSDGGWTLCLECLDAGCTPIPDVLPVGGVEVLAGREYGCQREDV